MTDQLVMNPDAVEALAATLVARGQYSVESDWAWLSVTSTNQCHNGPTAVVTVLADGRVMELCEDVVTFHASADEYVALIHPA